MIFKKLEKYLKNIDGKIAIYGIGKETEKNKIGRASCRERV